MSYRRIIAGFVIVIILIAGVLIIPDYHNYKDGNRSHFFGTLSNYSQDQTLRFGNLDLEVTDVKMKSYPKPTIPAQLDCSSLFQVHPVRNPGIFADGTNGLIPYGGDDYSSCSRILSSYNDDLGHYQKKDNLTVTFKYSNIGDKPLNLATYKVKLIANTSLGDATNIDYDGTRPSCGGFPKSQLLKGAQVNCITSDIDKGYHGPRTLSVTYYGKEKDISLKP